MTDFDLQQPCPTDHSCLQTLVPVLTNMEGIVPLTANVMTAAIVDFGPHVPNKHLSYAALARI